MKPDLYASVISYLESMDAKAKTKSKQHSYGSRSWERYSLIRKSIAITRRNLNEIVKWESEENE